jgi:hypothetical protein
VLARFARSRRARSSGGSRRGEPSTQPPSQRDVSLWCIGIMRSARKLANQTAHLGFASDVFGLGFLHETQQAAGAAPCSVGPSRALLDIGRAAENQGSGAEGETCLRCSKLLLHVYKTPGTRVFIIYTLSLFLGYECVKQSAPG